MFLAWDYVKRKTDDKNFDVLHYIILIIAVFDVTLGVEYIQWIGSLWGWFLFNQDSCCLYYWVNQIFVKVNSDITRWS